MRRLASLLVPGLLLLSSNAHADTELVLDGVVDTAGAPLDHFFLPFEVPAGTAEIEVQHEGTVAGNVLDFGLNDPHGFRGWGGGNTEPAIVGEAAASRSYLAGALPAGTWQVVVGKAQINQTPATYAIKVILRTTPTLAPQVRRPYVSAGPIAASSGPRFYAGDFHTHSRDSGDAHPSLDEMAAFAKAQGLDFIEVSDHNTTAQLDFFVDAQARHPELLLVPGAEYTTYDGHANAIGATEWFDHKIGQPGVTIQGAIDAIRNSGALFGINHPALDLGDKCIGCAFQHKVQAETIDAVEVSTGKADVIFGDATIAFWEKLLDEGGHTVAIGGSDDHLASLDQGAFGSPIGDPTTMVFADELSVAGIVAGVKSGRTVVRLTGQDAAMIELASSTPLTSGTSLVAGSGTTLTARVTGGEGKVLRFVRNAVADEPIDITSDPFEATVEVTASPDREVRVRAEVVKGNRRETITSHVFVPRGENGSAGAAGSGGGAASGGTSAGAASAVSAADSGDDGCGCRLVGVQSGSAVSTSALGRWAAFGMLGLGLGAAGRLRRRRRPTRPL
jgi:hypothetical protein